MICSYYGRVREEIVSEPSRCIDEGQSHLFYLLVPNLGPLKCLAREINEFLSVAHLTNEVCDDGFDRDGQV